MDMKDSIFEKGQIQSVIFDLDDTLFQTEEYYRTNMLSMASFASQMVGDNTPQIAERIFQEGVNIHRKNGRPVLLNELMKDALRIIYGENFPYQNHIHSYIDYMVEEFYKAVPKLFPGTLPVLEMLDSRGIAIAAHSHAQADWTERKIEYIKNRFLDEYLREIILPFHSTPLESKKDSLGWAEAIKIFGFNPATTLVVGDNLRDDILAAQEVGIEHVLLVNGKYSENTESEKGIPRINDIGGLLEL